VLCRPAWTGGCLNIFLLKDQFSHSCVLYGVSKLAALAQALVTLEIVLFILEISKKSRGNMTYDCRMCSYHLVLCLPCQHFEAGCSMLLQMCWGFED